MNQPLGDPTRDNPYEDHVCHQTVSPDTRYKSLYRGGEFFFCSRQCKREFDSNPQVWVSVSHAEMVSANHGVL